MPADTHLQEPWYFYWGKTDRDDEAEVPSHHLLPYHNLDVAAVAQVLLKRDDLLRRRLATVLGIPEPVLIPFVVFLLALHDVGKHAEAFQHLSPELMKLLQGDEGQGNYYPYHDTLGYLLWRDVLHEVSWKENWFGTDGHDADADDWWDYFDPIVQAITGHHGEPPNPGAHSVRNHFRERDRTAALAYARAVAQVVGPVQPFDGWDYEEHVPQARRATWLLAGLAILADWLGSNTAFFGFCDQVMPLERYWKECALPQAAKAIETAGVLAPQVAEVSGLHALFPEHAEHEPTPLQRYAATCGVSGRPQLFILEDSTGSGKTEAAVVLAHRIIQQKGASGLYFGLPTMATANHMHTRLAEPYRRLFAEPDRASYVLAHSARDFVRSFRETLRVNDPSVEPEEREGEVPTGRAQCAAWLADGRKKALLASVGVGTVDQALMGVLPSKHQALRLLGVGRGVLVVDEVHAYDEYVSGLLRQLLAFQAAMGGSAILLSATLPRGLRRQLCDAFRDGLGLPREGREQPREDAFPLATRVTAGGTLEEMPLDPRLGSERAVKVKFVEHEEEVRRRLIETAKAGGCACWIRNTVDDAVEVWETLQKEYDAGKVTLFHARFALGDRQRIEEDVVQAFGPGSSAEEREGRILIATQVVEQSLDLDFDFLASDLAPVDLLIQRAGREHRHLRDAAGNRIESGEDGRGEPVLLVLAPPYEDEPEKEDWFSRLFPRARYVYPHVGHLWRTMRVLREVQKIDVPGGVRKLLAEVYGEGAPAIPTSLEKASNKAFNEMKQARATAAHHVLHLEGGYGSLKAGGLRWFSDTRTPTRLGEPTTTVRLARRDGDRLIPWATADADEYQQLLDAWRETKAKAQQTRSEEDWEAARNARAQLLSAWQRSEVSIRERKVTAEQPWGKDKEPTKEEVKSLKENMPDGCRWSVLVALEEKNGQWQGMAQKTATKKNKKGQEELQPGSLAPTIVTYDSDTGLRV